MISRLIDVKAIEIQGRPHPTLPRLRGREARGSACSGSDIGAIADLASMAIYGRQPLRAGVVQVNTVEAKNRLSQLAKTAQAGEDEVIAKRGEPVARLLPAGPAPQAKANAGSARVILGWLKTHTPPAYVPRFAEEIDAAIDEERPGGIGLSRFLSRHRRSTALKTETIKMANDTPTLSPLAGR